MASSEPATGATSVRSRALRPHRRRRRVTGHKGWTSLAINAALRVCLTRRGTPVVGARCITPRFSSTWTRPASLPSPSRRCTGEPRFAEVFLLHDVLVVPFEPHARREATAGRSAMDRSCCPTSAARRCGAVACPAGRLAAALAVGRLSRLIDPASRVSDAARHRVPGPFARPPSNPHAAGEPLGVETSIDQGPVWCVAESGRCSNFVSDVLAEMSRRRRLDSAGGAVEFLYSRAASITAGSS